MSRRLPARKAAPARARLCRSPTDVTVGGSFEARLAGRCAPCPRSNQPSPVPSLFAATATTDFPRTCRLTYLLSARSACRRSLRIGPPVVMPSVHGSKNHPQTQSSFHCRRPAIGAVLGNKKSNLIAVRRSIGAQIFGNMLDWRGAEAFGQRCPAQVQTLARYASPPPYLCSHRASGWRLRPPPDPAFRTLATPPIFRFPAV